jgi:hypothetical protein
MDSKTKCQLDENYRATSPNFEANRPELDGKDSMSKTLKQNNNTGLYMTWDMYLFQVVGFEIRVQDVVYNCCIS